MTEDRPAVPTATDPELREHILAAAREMSLTRRHPVAVAIGTGIAGLVAGAIATAALFPLWAPIPPPPPFGFPPPPPGAMHGPPPGAWGPPPPPPGGWAGPPPGAWGPPPGPHHGPGEQPPAPPAESPEPGR